MSAELTQESRKAIAALERLIHLEEISVADAARHLKKTPAWIKQNFAVIYHSRKSQSVRVADIEAQQAIRTVFPTKAVAKFAKLLKKPPQWVRENLPVIYDSSGSVRVQTKRTVWPGRRH